MKQRMGPRARLVTGLAIVLAILFTVGIMATLTLRSLVETDRLVSHTQDVRTAIRETLSMLTDAETGQRGYLLTGDTTFLAPLRAAGRTADSDLAALARLVDESPPQRATLARVKPLVRARLERLRGLADLRRRGGATAISDSTLRIGRVLMDSIRVGFAAMEAEERNQLVGRRARAAAAVRRTNVVVAVGAVLALIISVAGVVLGARAESRRRASEARYAGVVEVLAEGVIVQDAAGRVLDCNASAERILGVPREGILRLHEPGTPWPMIREDGTPFPKDEHPALVTLRTSAAVSNVVMAIRRAGKQPTWLLVSSKPLTDEVGHVTGVVSSFADITRRREAEDNLARARDAAEHANRTKSEFLANMSHELRTPLNSVIGFAALMMMDSDGRLNDEQRDSLQRIHDNGRHLLELINSLLDLSKVEAGKMELELGPVDLKQLIGDTLSQFAPLVRSKGIQLVADVPDGVPPIEADAVRLRQVLINLVGNALKFTEKGSITVRVTTDARGRAARLDVIDTGIGIPPDRQDKVFEAFQQADTSTARKYGGTGLGLTITRSLLRLMGYTIALASEPGVGTTFTIHLRPPR